MFWFFLRWTFAETSGRFAFFYWYILVSIKLPMNKVHFFSFFCENIEICSFRIIILVILYSYISNNHNRETLVSSVNIIITIKECFTIIKENLSKSIKRPENQCF